ncbi:hypothetical protein ACWEOI_33430 [Nocardia sp. NPDC004340]|uniref:hypothetical protein n=1 Tax=Nocardia sp. CA-136227 TaxID=3239979 RepID=UPI003D96E483
MTDPAFDETDDEGGEADDGAYEDISERALAELFLALARHCEPDGPGWASSYPTATTDLAPVGATPRVRPELVRHPTAGTDA